MACTEFCNKINKLHLNDYRLPNYNDLVSHLEYSIETLRSGVRLGTLQEVSSRDQCPFCVLVLEGVQSALNVTEFTSANLHNDIYVLLLKDEQFFRLSFPSPHGTRLCFLAESDNQISGPGLARRVSETSIHPSKILNWLDICNKTHGKTCYHDRSQGLVPGQYAEGPLFQLINFRVIDLVHGCIIPVSLDSRFVTLSYVWGQLPMFRLQKDNYDSLTVPGSLSCIRSHLPQTINDAIDLTISLGEKYLWVDTLCLIQDDEQDLGSGVRIMNSIFERSYLTIVAASGASANAGLPGVLPNSRHIKQAFHQLVSGVRMTVSHSVDKYLAMSPYNDRGWTLQELILPRRSIIFVGSQVHFRCQESNWNEESTADIVVNYTDPDDSNLMRIPAYRDGPIAAYWAYMKLAEDFSRRTLRFGGDALRAFYGILRPIAASLNCELLEGLPWSYFDMSLLFISTKGNLRRRPEFASWSWAGWSGPIAWPRENYHWNEDGLYFFDATNVHKWWKSKTFIFWTAWHPNHRTEDISPFSPAPDDLPGVRMLLHQFQRIFSESPIMDVAKGRRCYHSYSGSGGSRLFGREIDEIGENSRVFSLQRADLCDSQRELDELRRNVVDLAERRRMMNWMSCRTFKAIRRRVAQNQEQSRGFPSNRDFWSGASVSAHTDFKPMLDPCLAGLDKHNDLRRKDIEHKRVRGELLPSISDHDVSFPSYSVLSFQTVTTWLKFGASYEPDSLSPDTQTIRVKGAELLDSTNSACGEMYLDNVKDWEAGRHVECILLSWCLRPPVPGDLDSAPSNQQEDLLWVMCIRWKNGIAERRGIGKISTSAVDRSLAPAVVKPILLA